MSQDNLLENLVLSSVFDCEVGRENLPVVLDSTRPEDFTTEKHQAILRSLQALDAKGIPLDPLTLHHELELQGKPISYSDICEFSLSGEYVRGMDLQYHISRLREASNRRKLRERLQLGLQEVEDAALEYPELVSRVGSNIMGILDDGRERELNTPEPVLKAILDLYFARKGERQGGRTIFGIPTPFPSVDAVLGGLQEGTSGTLAGRQGSGKSTVAMDIIHYAAKQEVPSLYISLEQLSIEILMHIIQKQTGLRPLDIKTGDLTLGEETILLEVHDKLKALPLFLEDRTRTLTEIALKIRRMALCHKVRLVVVDYLQLIENPIKGEPRHVQVAGISRALKRLAMEQKISILALSQLNKDPEGRATGKISLADTRESEAISQDADYVLFLHRPRLMGRDDEDHLELAKNRHGETIPRINVKWDGRFNTYREIPRDGR